MISAILLPLMLAGSPADLGLTGKDDPVVQIWINNNRRFLAGDRAKVEVRTRDDGYLVVLHADPDGRLRVLYPLDPDDDNFVRGGRKYEVRGRGGREAFTVDVSSGRGTVYAAVSRDPFRFDQFVLADHWDYRELAPNRLPREPETELTELVRRLAQGSFDYDLLTYDIIERVVYADDYSYSGSYYRPYYSPYRVSVGFFFGRPFHRHYYDPFYPAYDPFYSSYYYDPFYSGFSYYGSYYPFRTHYYRPYSTRFHFSPRHRTFSRPFTPFRFRGFDGGYRDRRFDLTRSVNTVYLPPVGRSRRDLGSVADPRDTPRDGHRSEPRLERRVAEPRPNIEARRAREPERPRVTGSNNRRGQDLPVEVRPPSRDDGRRVGNSGDRSRGEARSDGRDVRGTRSDARPSASPAPRSDRPPAREARPSRQDDGRSGSAPRAETRGGDRGGDRGRGTYSAPSGRGGDRGSSPGRSSGGNGGGFRRR